MKALLLSTLLLIIGCATKQYTPSEIQAESKRLNEFFEASFKKNVDRYPTWQTYLGLKTNYDKLDSFTEQMSKESEEIDKQTLKDLKKFDYDALDEQAKLSYDIFKYNLEKSLEGYEWRHHGFPFNQMFGRQQTIPSFLINMHTVSNVAEAEAYIGRLKEIKRVIDELMVFTKKQEEMGIMPPAFVYPKVISDARNIISGAPFDKSNRTSPLLKDFEKKVYKLKKVSSKKKNMLVSKARQALLSHVAPAFYSIIDFAENQQKKNKNVNGAWSLPDGDDYYEFMLGRITTTDLEAEEIHNRGLSEVSRIHNEMRGIMKQVGYKGTLQEFFKHIKGSKQFYYPNTKKGRRAYLRDTKKIIANMKKALPKMFNTFPKAKLKVKAVEEYRQKSAGIAFYQGPPLFGDRPGIYYVNLYKMEDTPKFEMEALAYHEALPGHHMQIAIKTELSDLPKFRRTGGFTAYSEGWGLYSELVPKEFGFYKDPYSDFGRLSMELWRACRLVVDTGIHHKKWSYDKAINFLKDNTPSAPLVIEKGIQRYFVMPGQATAYKIGMMKILELRKMAKEKLGSKFDIRNFHDVVLKDGALPLDVLEERVNQWISTSKM